MWRMSTISLTQRYAGEIAGELSCFDRVVFFGTFKAIGWPEAMGEYLHREGIGLLEYGKTHANALRLEVAEHIRSKAKQAGLEIIQVNHGERKEAVVERLLEKRGRHSGVVCILGAMERCRCYKVGKDREKGFLRLEAGPGKCQHYYVYFIDEEFGLCHLRIPTWAPFRLQACGNRGRADACANVTWAPFRLQACGNGHEWLERQLRAEGIKFTKEDNCFTHVGDYAAAQALAMKFDPQRLHTMLGKMAAAWVAVYDRFGAGLHWSIAQAEWATDIIFKKETVLHGLYREIVRTAALEVECADIYRFFGKRPTVRGAAERSSRFQTLVQGTRLKHTLGPTSLKMYDKARRVLRIECTTHDITSFTHYRQVEPRRSAGRKVSAGSSGPGSGSGRTQHAPMRRTIYSLPALAAAMEAATQRYLLFISQWPDRTKERHELCAVSAPARDQNQRSHRGLNFFHREDLQFLQAILRGEHQIGGLRNRTLQAHLPGWKPQKIGRTLRRFRALKLLKRVHGTWKYYLTHRGLSVLVAGRQVTERVILPALAA